MTRPPSSTLTLFLTAGLVAASTASAQHGDGPGPLDHNLHLVRELLEKSETETVAIVALGDSRSSWSNNRLAGAIFRQWDVQFASLYMDGSHGNAGARDGLGQMVIEHTGFDAQRIRPGETSGNSGIANRWPVNVSETWAVQDQTGLEPQNSRYARIAATAGGVMYSNASGAPGGTFKRGDPAQGRDIISLEYFAIANSEEKWLPMRMEMGFNASESGALGPIDFPAPTGSSLQPTIHRFIAEGPNATGVRPYWRFRDIAPPPQNRGHIWAGSRINYDGSAGIILGIVAQGGWATSDHLPRSVFTLNDNYRWKYGDDQFVEWYQTCIRAPRALVRIEIGANQNTIGGNFREWNGEDTGHFQRNVRLMAQRAKANLTAAGAQEVVIQLVGVWTSGNSGGNARDPAINADLRELALQQGWAFYDQQGHLQHGGFTINDGELKAQYRHDSAHQNFDGMNLLGMLEWQAIETALDPCYANCNRATAPPILTVNDFTCFINAFAQAQSLPHEQQIEHYANCDRSTTMPALTVNDFTCFINAFAQGCP